MNLLSTLRSIQTEVTQAINQLEQIVGGQVRSANFRRRNTTQNNVTPITHAGANTGRRRRHLTAAARKKMSLAAKERWASHKKAA